MVKRSSGLQSGRSKTLRRRRSSRKIGTARALRQFKPGDVVHIDLRAGFEGMPHGRYKGRTGTVVRQQGSAYVIDVREGGKVRKIISDPVHLRPYRGAA